MKVDYLRRNDEESTDGREQRKITHFVWSNYQRFLCLGAFEIIN